MKQVANATPKTNIDQIKESITEHKAELISIGKGISGNEIELKANTVRASIATNIESTIMSGIGQLGVKERSLYDEATKLPLSESNNSGQISYIDWDEATIVRSAAAVAEGATFPESTAAFKNYQVSLKKIGDTLPVTEEFFDDEALSAAELEMFLEVNVNAEVDRQLILGDGTGNTMTGLIASTPEWTPVAYGIPDANIYDLIQKMTTVITTNRGSKYKRERIKAVMNSNTYDLLVLKKDANNNYQFAPNHPIYNRIVIDNNMADDKMVVGDLSYIRIYEKPGVMISKGEINAQFTYDLMTLKARTRKLMVIRTVDQTGFLRLSTNLVSTALYTIGAVVNP
jgi:HK97 family phage major capsid protein